MMWKLLTKINKNLVLAIPGVLVCGFGVGLAVDPVLLGELKILIIPFTFLMVYPMMVSLNISHLFAGIKNVRLQLVTQIINFGVIPFLAYGAGVVFFPDQPYMALGLLLAAILPTSGMTISWTGFAGGNLYAAINMTIIGLTLGAILTPLYIKALLGTRIMFDYGIVVRQIMAIVFIPMFLGYLSRRLLEGKDGQKAFKEIWGPRFPPLSAIGVLAIVFLAMALKAKTVASDPALLLYILMILLFLYSLYFVVATVVGKLMFKRDDAIALVFGSAIRNLSVALAIAINVFGDSGTEAALVITVAFIVQVQAAAWYVKFTGQIFGQPGT